MKIIDSKLDLKLYPDPKPIPEKIIVHAINAEGMNITNFPFQRELPLNCSKLKFQKLLFTRTDRNELETSNTAGITVSNAEVYSPKAVADYSLVIIIAVLRHIHTAESISRSGNTCHGQQDV